MKAGAKRMARYGAKPARAYRKVSTGGAAGKQ
jgi:hypothetical protein